MSDIRQQFLINAYKEAHKSCKEIHMHGWVSDTMKQQTEECTRRMFKTIIENMSITDGTGRTPVGTALAKELVHKST